MGTQTIWSRRLAHILQDPAYHQGRTGTSFWIWLSQVVTRWLASLPLHVTPAFSRWLLTAGAIAVLALAVWTWRLFDRSGRRRRLAQPSPASSGAGGDASADWLLRADRCLQSGDLRAAARGYFLAAVCRLAPPAAALHRCDVNATTGEWLRAARTIMSQPADFETLSRFGRTVDEVCYSERLDREQRVSALLQMRQVLASSSWQTREQR